jgi:hypothetical protein
MAIHQTGVSGPRPDKQGNVSFSGLWWGFLLLVGGSLWLVHTAGIFRVEPAVTAVVFGIAGAGFAYDYLRSARNWWSAIPAGAFLGISALIAVVEATPAPGEWGASTLLAATGLGFAAAYLRTREHTWALIPAALLFVVAFIVAFVPILVRGTAIGAGVVGMVAAALAVFAFVPVKGARMLWLLVPAAIMAVVAGFLAVDATEVLEPFNWVTPFAVLVIGLLLVVRTGAGRGAGR